MTEPTPEKPAANRVSGGISPRFAVLATGGILVVVIAIGVWGRDNSSPTATGLVSQ